MAAVQDQDVLARTIVGFSRDGMFPEEDEVSAIHVQSSALPAALNALASAKVDLEVRLFLYNYFRRSCSRKI
jgi:protein transport protein DSL1/ZW10